MAAEEGQVIGVHSIDAWKSHLQSAAESKKIVVVDFTASWCGPCRFIAPILAELAKKFTNLIFLKVDVDELKSVAEENGVDAMPTFIFFKEGKEINRIIGAQKDVLAATIKEHAGDASASA